MFIRVQKKDCKILGLGGQQKSSACFISDGQAECPEESFDLNVAEGIKNYKKQVYKLIKEHGKPDIVVHDMHPDFYSSVLAKELGASSGCKTMAVQHHYAHISAVAAENNVTFPYLGFALDGFGLGFNNELWGGELIYASSARTFTRVGRLKPVIQAGGDLATQETWRLGAAFILKHKGINETLIHFSESNQAFINSVLKGINCPQTSSCGRLFDLACVLSGKQKTSTIETLLQFEKEAGNPHILNQGFIITHHRNLWEIDLSPLLLKLFYNKSLPAADLFHGTLAEALASCADEARKEHPLASIVLGGGCFLNKVLKTELKKRLNERNFTVFTSEKLPTGDEAIAFGNAVIGLNSF